MDSGWICAPFGVSELPDDGVSGTHFALCICDVYLLCQRAIKGDTKVCRIVTVCKGVMSICFTASLFHNGWWYIESSLGLDAVGFACNVQ